MSISFLRYYNKQRFASKIERCIVPGTFDSLIHIKSRDVNKYMNYKTDVCHQVGNYFT